MRHYKLSFILSTYNKVEFLKVTLPKLYENILDDEEIVVVDGGSNDGTEVYLRELFDKGLVNIFLSEKDQGEAHGFNKAIFLANGELIKIITDDDVFDLDVIRNAKDFLLKNPDHEMVVANLCSTDINDPEGKIRFLKSYETWFKDWEAGKRNATFFCGLTMMITKRAFSRLGLFDTSFKFIDLEFSVRVTSNRAKIKFLPQLMTVSILNSKSNTKKWELQNEREIQRLRVFYNYEHTWGGYEVPYKGIVMRALKKFKLIKPQYEEYPDFGFDMESNVVHYEANCFSKYYDEVLKVVKDYNQGLAN